MRRSGILMHITSLPGAYGVGTMGKSAYEFVDFLKEAGQSYWQVLPLCQTGFGDSPYQSFSTFALNPYFISLDALMEEVACDAGKLNEVYRQKQETEERLMAEMSRWEELSLQLEE
mgnify:CR=1 FL=1